mmetsp:Transcript_73299/g.192168  ORF Transcript_73299/g.192168 Transcript_73299/m.192168 type:complete len:350 (+) Transcript_73299:127-1176(+)
MLALLVAAATVLPAAAGRHAASRPVNAQAPSGVQATGPLRQSSTAAQDSQECGFLLLPERIQLAPTSPTAVERYGVWETLDSASLATWQQPLLRWSVDAEYFSVGPKLFMKVMHEAPDDNFPGTDTVSLRDCADQLMYTLRADTNTAGTYRIYNRAGEFVARSTYSNPNDDVFKDSQLEFYDSFGQPIAIAHCPQLPGPGVDYHLAMVGQKASRGFGGISPWQVLFLDQAESNSSLLLAQNRWVVAAVVQDLALRDAPPPDLRVWFVVLCAVPFGLATLLVCSALGAVHDAAYRKPNEIANPFLKDWQQYGTLAAARGRPSSARPESVGVPGGFGIHERATADLYRSGN